jgi:predicted lipid-binding transport protein (Tim44 family)
LVGFNPKGKLAEGQGASQMTGQKKQHKQIDLMNKQNNNRMLPQSENFQHVELPKKFVDNIKHIINQAKSKSKQQDHKSLQRLVNECYTDDHYDQILQL